MRKLLRYILLLSLITLRLYGQQLQPFSYSFTTIFTGNANSSVNNLIGNGATYHIIAWYVTGTVTGCNVTVDSSSNGSSFSTGGVITSQACTSNGTASSSAVTPNYVRLAVTNFTGTGSVTIIIYGYVNNPAAGGSMVWPVGSAGVPNYSGSNSWGTTYSASNLIPSTFIANAPVKQFITSTYSQTFSASYTPASVTGLSWSIAANSNYTLDCRIMYGLSAGTAVPNFALTGPAAPTLVSVSGYGTGSTGVTLVTYATQSTNAFPTQFGLGNGTTSANDWTNFTVIIENGANAGTIQVQAGAAGTGTLTINAFEASCILF